MKKLTVLLALFALVPFALAACGDDDDENTTAATTAEETTADSGGGGGETLTVTAAEDGSLAFDEDSLEAAAGTATIDFDNPSSVPHNVKIEDDSGSEIGGTDTVTGESTTAEVELEPGEYTFFCDIPGHREGGMEGPLTVE